MQLNGGKTTILISVLYHHYKWITVIYTAFAKVVLQLFPLYDYVDNKDCISYIIFLKKCWIYYEYLRQSSIRHDKNYYFKWLN